MKKGGQYMTLVQENPDDDFVQTPRFIGSHALAWLSKSPTISKGFEKLYFTVDFIAAESSMGVLAKASCLKGSVALLLPMWGVDIEQWGMVSYMLTCPFRIN